MSNTLSKEINDNLDTNKLYFDVNLNRMLNVEVDKSFLDKQNKMTNEIIKISLNDLYNSAVARLQTISKLLKKVKLDNPNKQSFSGRFFEIPLEIDLHSSTTILYEELKWVSLTRSHIKKLIAKADDLEKEFQEMINKNSLPNLNETNKMTLLVQIKGLKNIRSVLLQLENCYSLIENHPEIKRYIFYWSYYKNFGYFPIKCIFNDEAYKFFDNMDELIVGESNVIREYNDLRKLLQIIKKNSKNFNSFFLHASLAYEKLIRTYNDRINNCLITIDNYYKRLKKQETSDDAKSKMISLELMKKEFIKLKGEIDELASNKKIYEMGVKSGLFFFDEISQENKKDK